MMFDKVVWEVGKKVGEAREGMAAISVDESKMLEGAVDGGNLATR